MQPISVRCQNVAGVWIGSLEHCEQSVRVFFPYITKLVKDALRTNRPETVEVYTCFDVSAFASGASSLEMLKWLLESEYKVFHLDKLHAKVFENPSAGFATIGSQNLTDGGTKNRESTVIIRESLLLNKLKIQLDRWSARRYSITPKMILEAETAVVEHRRLFRALGGKCRRAGKEIFAAQAKRDEEERLAADKLMQKAKIIDQQQTLGGMYLLRKGDNIVRIEIPIAVKHLAEALGLGIFQLNRDLMGVSIYASPEQILSSEVVAYLCQLHGASLQDEDSRKYLYASQELIDAEQAKYSQAMVQLAVYQADRQSRLARLGEGLSISKEIYYYVASNAQNLKIRGPSYPSPGDANHLNQGKYGWEINLGGKQANRFGVALAIHWCREELAKYYPSNKVRLDGITVLERQRLISLVRSAVLDFKGKPYKGTYPVEPDGSMKLGNHYLMPTRTVNAVLKISGFDQPWT